MKALIILAFSVIAGIAQSQNEHQKFKSMKLNAGIITEKLEATKAFYTETLGFGIAFENDFYLLMHTPDGSAQLSFLKPNHPSQQPIFRPAFNGKGVYLTIEVEDVDKIYEQLKKEETEIVFEIRSESWGDRHFAVEDPNGVGIDIVTYTKPEGE